MIEIITMPDESKSFARVLECMELRQAAVTNRRFRIGHASPSDWRLTEIDRTNSIHLISSTPQGICGYVRLVRVDADERSGPHDQLVQKIATASGRRPALEMQWMNVDARDFEDTYEQSHPDVLLVREMVIEALRVAQRSDCKHLVTQVDTSGSRLLQKAGLRHSAISLPIHENQHATTFVAAPVSSQTMRGISPLKIVHTNPARKSQSSQLSPA